MKLPAIVLATVFVISSCGHRDRRVTRESVESMAVNKTQMIAAVKAVDHLRATFNTGSCESIYNEASPMFREQSSLQWTDQCEALRKSKGDWKNFKFEWAQRCGTPQLLVCVIGYADFATESREMSVIWLLDGQSAKLESIELRQDDQHWSKIPDPRLLPRELHRLVDPPLFPRDFPGPQPGGTAN